jgi:hypothetical protein
VTGPKMLIDQVDAALQVVANAVTEMQGVARTLGAQSGVATAAMIAPAGRITSANYEGHQSQGQLLGQVLDQLGADLRATKQVLLAGSDEATGIAQSGGAPAPGGIASQM